MDDMAQKNHVTLPADFVIGYLLLKITHMSSLDQDMHGKKVKNSNEFSKDYVLVLLWSKIQFKFGKLLLI
ncbi:hypothetical protein YC2023_084841 [Brassica napus]